MAKKQPLSIGFNLPFHEAIAAAKLRGVVLPDIYYGELQGIARQLAFSIAGVASLDQLQAVKDSLHAATDKGVSFKDWKKTITVQSLNLPDHRLDNIWRTNLQGNYMRGKAEQFQRNKDRRPFLMYDAINDSRVRPNHLAMDGVIRHQDDPFWRTHFPPNGFRCVVGTTGVKANAEKALKTFYSGEVFEITTKRGYRLTITPNHPILTFRGFIPANQLFEGDELLSDCVSVNGGNITAGFYDEYMPPRADDLFDSFPVNAFAATLPISALDLHGDAMASDGKIDIKIINGHLLTANYPIVKKSFYKSPLNYAKHGWMRLSVFGRLLSGYGRSPSWLSNDTKFRSSSSKKCLANANSSLYFRIAQVIQFDYFAIKRVIEKSFSPSFMNGIKDSLSNFWGFRLELIPPTVSNLGLCSDPNPIVLQNKIDHVDANPVKRGKLHCRFPTIVGLANFFNRPRQVFKLFSPSQSVVLRSASLLHASLSQKPLKESVADSVLFQQLKLGNSGTISSDYIVSIRNFTFSGHVYDFETVQGYYIANGIIISNCRCSVISLTEAQAKQRSNGNNGINKVPVDKNGLPAMPDKGWHHNPFEDRLQWVDEALAKLDPELQAVGKKMVEQAAELVKKPVFVPAATVKEAEKWMMDNDVVDLCDFGKIKDVDLVNEWNRAMFEHIQEFPELRKNQKFTGSSQAQVRTWYKDQIAKTAEWFRQNYVGISESESIENAKKIVKRMKVGNFWAWSWNHKIVQGISINEKWATQPDKLQQNLLSSLFSGFHPINCETIKSIVDHELGHQLDALLDLSSDKGIIDIRKATQDIEKELSGYAKTNIAEFIAEAWAEYRNNPNPRPVAKQVGELIRERYAARYAAG